MSTVRGVLAGLTRLERQFQNQSSMGGGSGSGCGVPMKTCKACSKECNIGCKKCQHCDANIGKGPKLKKTIIKKKCEQFPFRSICVPISLAIPLCHLVRPRRNMHSHVTLVCDLPLCVPRGCQAHIENYSLIPRLFSAFPCLSSPAGLQKRRGGRRSCAPNARKRIGAR